MPTDSRAGLQFVAGLAWVNTFVLPVLGVVLLVSGIVLTRCDVRTTRRVPERTGPPGSSPSRCF